MARPDRDKDSKKSKERISERKWKSLKARGINPPADEAEARERLKAAHGY